jgi:hypothetical protein
MAVYKILYWQELPSQIRAEDDDDEVNLPLSGKFAARIDAVAMERGMRNSDEYLAHWHWGDEQHRDGTAQEVVDAVRAELEAQAGW